MNKPFPFQLSRETCCRSSTLGREDVGKWCFTINGALHGFCQSRTEAQQMIDQIFDKENLPRGK